MKLLLTSNGIINQTIADNLKDLVGKQPSETKVGFIPTAVDVDTGNKDWFINQLTDLQKFGFNQIDIVEIAAMDIDWQDKLSQVDVIYAGGGNPYLLHVMNKVKFGAWLKQNLDSKVYVGGSSGAIVVTPSIGVAQIKSYGSINTVNLQDLTGLSLVNFEVAPHVPDWPSYEEVEDYTKTIKNQVYAIDNQTGIKVVDGKIDIASEGKWKLY